MQLYYQHQHEIERIKRGRIKRATAAEKGTSGPRTGRRTRSCASGACEGLDSMVGKKNRR